MKTYQFRLLATMITLAAVVTATIPSYAQRRSASDIKNEKKVEATRTGNKKNIEKKSTFRNTAKEPKASNRSVKNSVDVKQNSPSAAKEMKREVSKTSDYLRTNRNNKSNRQVSSNNSGQNRVANREINNNRTNYVSKDKKNNRDKTIASSEMIRRSTGRSVENSGNDNRESYNSNRAVTSRNSERYNLNKEDVRYKPNKDYRGSNKYWSSDFRKENSNKNYSGKNYNYNNYNHWDRNWEGYRWNHNSWINYYAYYDPYSYKNYKYYYHHPYYGHVVRRFDYSPQIFVHNHIKYYCYDGHFFRYHRGVGYILVDIPFGMAFDYLPNEFDRVYINGYLYFRIGNLFFESTNYGFSLVHYPERYFAFNEGYCNEGYRFSDMNY